MPASVRDTIAAIATARGRAGIAVVRISGPDSPAIAARVLGTLPPPRRAALRDFIAPDGIRIDRGLVLYFQAPGSYTGEDIVELHAHGGDAVQDMLLEAVLRAGARQARPGEFTERAFLEGRIDLAQAEAVADLIDAGSRHAARAAQATLAGEFSCRVDALVRELTALRVQLEASLDFADEDIAEIDPVRVVECVQRIEQDLLHTLQIAARGVRLRDGLRAVLLGAPNVGKSSVLNRLAGQERAIVTSVPGTTRDVIRESVAIEGASVELLDTAGIHASDDVVEQAGMARTREQARHADLLLLVEDDRVPAGPPPIEVPADADLLVIRNKVDLSGGEPGAFDGGVRVSALSGAGFAALSQAIASRAAHASGDGLFSARQRHLDALREALDCVRAASEVQRHARGAELVAEELRRAQVALGAITGAVSSDDLLGKIFTSFCIGK